MAGYCAIADLESVISDPRMAEYTAEDGTVADTDVLGKVISDSSDEIDRYLGGRYIVPVTDASTITILRPACISICRYKLVGRRSLEAKDDPVRVEYENAIRWLRDIQKGDASLPPSASTAEVPAVVEVTGVFGSQTAVFKDYYF